MQLIVPMAGLGQRFVDAGYDLPKPLIPVSGEPMIVRVVHDLPPAERTIFIVHAEHVRRHGIDATLRQHFPCCRVVVSPGLTEGQACTVRLASEAVEWDDEVLVAACDATHLYDGEKFDLLRGDDSIDCIAWTYRGEPRVLVKPTAYGWVRTRPGSIDIEHVSCKAPISQDLLGDRVVSGFFWFRTARLLFEAIDRIVADNRRVNNEFYLDVAPNAMIDGGRRAVCFDVEKYIGWGTPSDLEDFQKWQRYFAGARALV